MDYSFNQQKLHFIQLVPNNRNLPWPIFLFTNKKKNSISFPAAEIKKVIVALKIH
jgi:hypothetical protein